MEYSPTPKRGSHFALLLLSTLALKISQVFISQVGSITLLLPERVLPTPIAKINIILKTAKKLERKMHKKG